MNSDAIKEYAALMRELGLSGMEIKTDEGSIRLEMSSPLPRESAPIPYASAPAASSAAPKAEKKDYKSLKADFVGIFYSSPSEAEEAYVKVGDFVKKGETVCIIEAMKLINEISMPEDGIIREICVKHGQLVEYGTALFKYEEKT